jgi:hypothetical protein
MECHNNNIVICTFKGAMGVSMAKRFLDNLTNFALQFQHKPWGFVAQASEFQGAALGAEEYLVASYSMAIQHNCKSDTYCITSPMAIAQLAKLRQQCNLTGLISQRICTGMDQATILVQTELASKIAYPASKN